MSHANDIKSRVHALLGCRQGLGFEDRPYVVWEASTSTYFPQHLQTCLKAVLSVDVFSPNDVELLALFTSTETEFQKTVLEELASKFLEAGIGPGGEGLILVRAAEHGCLIVSRTQSPVWLPAFYEAGDAKVLDTTGAGNAFL